MWVETGAEDWLDKASKAWPILITLGTTMAYLVGTRVRARMSDTEQAATTNAVKKLEGVMAQLVEQVTRTQEHISSLTQKLGEACSEIKELRSRIERNAGNISNLRGRLGFRESRDD